MDNQENLTVDTEEKPEEQQKEPEMAAESTENVSRETLDGFKISFDANMTIFLKAWRLLIKQMEPI